MFSLWDRRNDDPKVELFRFEIVALTIPKSKCFRFEIVAMTIPKWNCFRLEIVATTIPNSSDDDQSYVQTHL